MGLLTLFSLPLLLFPGLIVDLILGDQWLSATPLLRFLVLAGLLQSLSTQLYNFQIAHKKYNVMNIHLLTSVVTMICLMLVFTPRYGLLGAAGAIFASRLISLPIIGWGVVQSIRQ